LNFRVSQSAIAESAPFKPFLLLVTYSCFLALGTSREQSLAMYWHLSVHTMKRSIRVIESRMMRWAGQVARIGEVTNVYIILVGNLKGRDHSVDQA